MSPAYRQRFLVTVYYCDVREIVVEAHNRIDAVNKAKLAYLMNVHDDASFKPSKHLDYWHADLLPPEVRS